MKIPAGAKFYYKCPSCNEVAFFMTRIPNEGEVTHASDFILLSGLQPIAGEKIFCDNCHLGLSGLFSRDVFPVQQKAELLWASKPSYSFTLGGRL